MEVRTEAYPHNWGGSVTCGVCGADHHADCASVRLVVTDDEGDKWIADDLCPECIAKAAEAATGKVAGLASRMRRYAQELREKAEETQGEALRWEQAAESPAGPWATLEDLRAAARAAKEYQAYEPPPEPAGWKQRSYDGEEIPF